MKFLRTFWLPFAAASAALIVAGCETDDSGGSSVNNTRVAEVTTIPPPAGVHTIKMNIDSEPPDAQIALNGVLIGYTPRDVHLEVGDDGRLLYNVTINITHKRGATSRALLGAGTGAGGQALSGGSVASAGGQDASYTYQAGDHPPSTVTFNNGAKIESRKPAPFDIKPVNPDARREN